MSDENEMSEEFPALTKKEVEAARMAARKKAEKDVKDKALKAIEQKTLEEVTRENALLTGDVNKDDLVWVTIDCAPFTDRITLDFREYHQGRSYEVSRAIADTLKDTMSRGWAHYDEVDGKSLTEHFQAAIRNTAIDARTGQRVSSRGV